MRIFVTVLTIALIAASGAMAAAPRVSDNDYLRMARCAGLTEGSHGDAAALNAALEQAREGRGRLVRDSGIARRRSAMQQMQGARGDFRAQLQTELSTRCAVVTG